VKDPQQNNIIGLGQCI